MIRLEIAPVGGLRIIMKQILNLQASTQILEKKECSHLILQGTIRLFQGALMLQLILQAYFCQ